MLIHDPYCDSEEAKAEFGVDLITDLMDIKPVSAIVLAVAHQPYKDWRATQWQELLQVSGIVIDVKGIFPKDLLNKTGLRVWRL